MYRIPIENIPAQQFQILLGDYQCTLTLYQRGRSIFMDLEADGETVWQGRICRDRQAVGQFRTPLFSGDFYFRDNKGTHHPYYEELGDRYELYYLEEGEDLPDGF